MIRRLTDLAKGLLAIAAIAALLIGVPLLVYRLGGIPGSSVVEAFTDPLTSDTTRSERLLAGTLGIIAWLCWLQVAYALVAEIVAAARGTVANRAPILPGIQAAASRLVTTATLVAGSFGQTATVMAVPLAPVVTMEPAVAAPLVVDTGIRTVDSATGRIETPGPTYTTGERDTFWSVAETLLGDGLRWSEVRDANVGRLMPDGTTIHSTTEELGAGWDLVLPHDAVLPLQPQAGDPTPAANAEAVEDWIDVEHGDHFWSIAEEALTDVWGRAPTDTEIAPYWAELVQTNDGRLLPPEDPNLIYPDQRFLLPPMPEDPTVPEAEEYPTDSATPTEVPRAPAEEAPEPAPSTTTSATTAPSTTIAEPPSTTVVQTPDLTQAAAADETSIPLASVALGLGAVSVGAGSLAVTLRRRRGHQAAKRQPGTTLEPPADDLIEYEQRIRPVADTEASRWVAATNKLITARLATQTSHRLPAVVAMRAGRFGVEVLLDEPCAPLEGFVPGNAQNSAWRLHPDLELRMIEAETEDAQPYCPALVTVGTTEAGDLLLDLEQIGVLSVEGDEDTAHSWFRSIATSIAAAEWSQLCEVVAVGGIEGIDRLASVTASEDAEAWVARTVTSMRKLHDRLEATPYEQRVKPGEIFHPTVVLVAAEEADAANALAEAAALVNTPLSVVAACPLPVADRVHLDPRRGTLEPIGVEFEPALTEPVEATAVAELLDNAEHAEVMDAPEPEVVAPEPAEGREPVADVIERVMAPKPIEVRLLRPKPSVDGLESDPPAKQLSVICYLAYHRSVTSQRLRDTFWPNATSRKTADNAISQIRTMLGVSEDGDQRLTQAINTGENQLSDDVGCDWRRAEALINAARGRPAAEQMELLATALELVGGQIGADAPARQFAWLVDDHQVYGHMERVLVDAASALGELALEASDLRVADAAARAGFKLVPGSETMCRLRMRSASRRGDGSGVEEAYAAATQAALRSGLWTDVEAETAAMWEELGPGRGPEAASP